MWLWYFLTIFIYLFVIKHVCLLKNIKVNVNYNIPIESESEIKDSPNPLSRPLFFGFYTGTIYHLHIV